MERVFVRTVAGYEREYVVSCFGDVFSIPRKGAWLIRKLKPQINHNGYEKVTLLKNNCRKYMFVHRIVANAFIENPENKRTVNHKDGNKRNNAIENLEWATHSENRIHAVENNLGIIAKGEAMSKKLTNSDVIEILNLRNKGYLHKEIAMKFKIGVSTVQCILNGSRWSSVTGIKPLK